MKRRSIVVLIILILLALTSATVYAVVEKINEPKPIYDYEKEEYILTEDYFEYIEKYKISDEKQELTDIPIYIESDFTENKGGFVIFARDSNFYDEFPNVRPDYTSRILTAYPTTAIRDQSEDQVYFVYGTENGSRIYMFFYKENGYEHKQGFTLLGAF